MALYPSVAGVDLEGDGICVPLVGLVGGKLVCLESIDYKRIILIFASVSLDQEISKNFSVMSQLVRKLRQTEQIFRNFLVK